MVDNKHFIQFLNQLGLTVNEMGKRLNISYSTAKDRSEMLNFTLNELVKFSEITTIPLQELVLIVAGTKSIKDIVTPYALTKRIAIEKLTQDDDFLRMILECNFAASQRQRTASLSEIHILKRFIIKNKNNEL